MRNGTAGLQNIRGGGDKAGIPGIPEEGRKTCRRPSIYYHLAPLAEGYQLCTSLSTMCHGADLIRWKFISAKHVNCYRSTSGSNFLWVQSYYSYCVLFSWIFLDFPGFSLDCVLSIVLNLRIHLWNVYNKDPMGLKRKPLAKASPDPGVWPCCSC